jgi:hypothetical protein
MFGTTPESGDDVAVVASSKMVVGVSGGGALDVRLSPRRLLLLPELDWVSEPLDEDLYDECIGNVV